MTLSALVTLALLSTSLLTADVLTQATCSLTNTLANVSKSQVDPSSCNVTLVGASPFGDSGTSEATISGTVSGPGSAAAGLTSTFSGRVSSVPALSQKGSAEAKASFSVSLFTAGPPRSGYVQILGSFEGGQGVDPADGTLDITLDSLSGSCRFLPKAVAGCAGINPLTTTPVLMPFELGEPFTFSETFDLIASSFRDIGLNAESGNASIGTNFVFLEGDAATPVQVFSVPEPSGFFLVVGVCFALVVSRRSKKNWHSLI